MSRSATAQPVRRGKAHRREPRPRRAVVGLQHEFDVELFLRIVRYYGANATGENSLAFARNAGKGAR